MQPTFIDPTAPVDHVPNPTADDKREMAFGFDPHFMGRPLHAFTLDRQCLVKELMGRRIGPSSVAATEAFMPEIFATLFLCLHIPQQWRHLRANSAEFWEAIESWANDNVPRSSWDEAFLLVYGQQAEPEITDPATGTITRPALPYVMGLWDAARAGIVAIKSTSAGDHDDDTTSGKSPRP